MDRYPEAMGFGVLDFELSAPLAPGFLERSGVLYLPGHSPGGQSERPAEVAPNLEDKALARLVELGNAAYATLAEEGLLDHLPAAKRRSIARLAEIEEERPDTVATYADGLRQSTGLTSQAIAANIGLSPAAVSRFFSGERQSNILTVAAILAEINNTIQTQEGEALTRKDIIELLVRYQSEQLERKHDRRPDANELSTFRRLASRTYERSFT